MFRSIASALRVGVRDIEKAQRGPASCSLRNRPSDRAPYHHAAGIEPMSMTATFVRPKAGRRRGLINPSFYPHRPGGVPPQ